MSDRRRGSSLQALACALGLLSSTVLGLGYLYTGDITPVGSLAPVAHLDLPKSRVPLVRDRTAAAAPSLTRSALLDPTLTSSWNAAPFVRNAPLRSHIEHADVPKATVETVPEVAEATPVVEDQPQPVPQIVPAVEAPPLVRDQAAAEAAAEAAADVPLPMPRPAFAKLEASRPDIAHPDSAHPDVAHAVPSTRYALREPPPGPAAAIAPPSDGRTLLERMFGTPSAATKNPALAYAAPGDTGTGFFGSRPAASAGTGTAVYNISSHTVTLPDGTKLEAHSGLGTSLDNPASVTQRMRGATPPSLYELTQREALFHGVRALRLTPLLEGTTFGRGGLLAHTFMLGPRGDSNGCVVFRDYQAFLAAYDSGQVRRLLVVAGT